MRRKGRLWNSARDKEEEGEERRARRGEIATDGALDANLPFVRCIEDDGRKGGGAAKKLANEFAASRPQRRNANLRDTLYAAPDAGTRGHPCAGRPRSGEGSGGETDFAEGEPHEFSLRAPDREAGRKGQETPSRESTEISTPLCSDATGERPRVSQARARRTV